VCAAAQYPVREAVGVEIDPALCTLAEANGRRLRRRRAPVRFACQSAADFDFDPTSVLVMFHPFGAATLRDVLDRVHASLLRRPRRLRLVYCNPVLGAVVAERRWLRLENAWAPGRWSRIKFPVHFYAAG
jgi:predicted RNA methylase